ncbi:MAG: VWA domain-containing protein [Acidobacteria bacterium]|nr:VWA domain-containing protein [Acidobacteriota bacterium]
MKRIAQGIIALLFMTVFVSARGQSQEDEVAVGTNLVSVNVTVTGSNGKSVSGLKREQFEVFDDNEKQQIAFFSAENAPTTFGIVYDMHPSTVERSTATLRALKQFTRTLRTEDDFFIVAFNERGSLSLDFIPTLEQVQTNLPMGQPKGAASLYDAVYMAAGKIRESRNPKRALLIISDGLDHNSRSSYREMRDRIRGFDVQIYSIRIDDSANTNRWAFEDVTRRTGRRTFEKAETAMGSAALAELAKASGGTAYFPEAAGERELAAICTQIALELRQQYAIGFYPTDATGGARWHRLRLRVIPSDESQGRLTLSYREGYQSFAQRR